MTTKEYNQVILAKVLLCGAFAVGKTSLVLRYVDGMFSTDTIQTLGANFLKKSLEHKGLNNELYKVDMQLWDLSGTIRSAESISRTFFMGTSGVLFVHDLTRNWTLNEIPSWYESVKAVSPQFVPIIVGNKADLEKKRETATEDSRSVAQKIGAKGVFETSAKNGEYVEEVFAKMAESLLSEFTEIGTAPS